MAISQGLAWSLANGITQEQYDKNIVDAIKRYEQQGYTDAQYESLMNQWGISPEDVARATGSRVQDIQARMQAATPTTPTEVEFERAAQAELGQRQAQAAAQQRQNEIDWAAQQKRNEELWAAKQRQNEIDWAEQQRINEIRNREQIAANEKAWAEQQRQNELAWAEQQRQNELAWAEQQRQNAVEWARQQALLNQGATGVGQFGAPGTFAQNFQNYMEIPIGAQYNPAVTPGGASPYSLVRAQMQPMQNPYAGFVAGTPMGGYDPNVYNTLLRQVDQEVLKNAIDEGLIGTAGGDSVGSGDAGGDSVGSGDAGADGGMSNSGEGGEGSIGGWAAGGLIDRVVGPNPPGKDDGLGMLQLGEYVVKKSAVDKYGKGLLDMINAGKVPAKKIKSLLD